jgi:hypothetical protein
MRSLLFQQDDNDRNIFLFGLAENIPPHLELFRYFNFPCHRRNISSKEYLRQGHIYPTSHNLPPHGAVLEDGLG